MLGVVDQSAHAKRLYAFTMRFYFTFIPRLCSTFNHSFPLRYTLSLQFLLFILFPVLVSQPLPSFCQYVCALGVEFSLSARQSLIIQRSAGIHQLLRGSPRLHWSTGCYLSIHPSFHYDSLCISTCMENLHRLWGEKYASHLSNVISKSACANLRIWSRGGWLVAPSMKETEWGHAGAGSSFSSIINSTCCSSTAGRGGVTDKLRN